MAIIERDVVHQGMDADGNPTIDLPVTRLGLIEDTADVKAALEAADYLPLIDMSDQGQMKKILASVLMAAIKSGITLESLGAAASSHNHAAGNVTSGVFATDRIPSLDASKIASGTFDAARIPSLDAGKLTSGILPIARGGTGNANGLAATATKLATARTIRINLASTAAPGFDGSANVTPGVTGVLPVANGGTGVATLAALAAALQSGGGMCKIQTGSYVGTGTYGASNPCTLTFDFVPKIVIITGRGSYIAVLFYGQSTQAVTIWSNHSPFYSTWSGTTVSWYQTQYAGYQLNDADEVYTWAALG